jgi:hypothetical protein
MLDKRPELKGTWQTIVPDGTTAEEWIAEHMVPGVPRMDCKGLCHDQCTVIPVTPVERRRVEAAGGRRLFVTSEGRCSMLDDNNRCVGYAGRPLICRMWGASEGMICPHGCETRSGRYLTHGEGMALMAERRIVDGCHEVTRPLP